jgi:hypothetical protein
MSSSICKTFLSPKEINLLVLKLKNEFDEKKFNIIIENTKRIYFKRIESYFRRKNFLSELEKDNLKDEYKSFIYNAIYTYDSSKMTSFTTYLHNLTNYTLYTLYTVEFKEERKKNAEWFIAYEGKINDGDNLLNQLYKKEEYFFVKEILKNCLDKFHDKRIKKILDIRFNTYEYKNAPWKEVSEKIGCSKQYCHFLLEQFFNRLRIELKKYSYVSTK